MDTIILEGKISVKAALFSPYREVINIYIDKKKKDRDSSFIKRKAQEKGIKVTFVEREEIDAMASGKTHGGVIAEVSERSFQHIDDILKENVFLAIVEGVEDPFNYGSVLRSLYAAGCDGILVSERNWTTAASTLAKSSAGASEYLPMIVCTDFDETLQYIKNKGVRIICANRDDSSIVMYDEDYTKSICICIGGEKRGLSKVILNNSDQNVYIPYNQEFKNALSAQSASTILAYEVLRQRRD